MVNRLKYWNRILKAYILAGNSHISFWHDVPGINEKMKTEELGQYYMPFHYKADYNGYYDENGIPMLNYKGNIGLQYNPIAIAQYGLGNYNLWCDTYKEARFQNFITAADWLVDNLVKNRHGLLVWMHHFDFNYRDILRAPWYSGLAQGQGISLLLRAHKETNDNRFIDAANKAFQSFFVPVSRGGVVFKDKSGDLWIEEYIVEPPTHVLNGFIWGLWGIYDYAIYLNDEDSLDLFKSLTKTIIQYLHTYDNGFWSLYEHSGTKLKMISSPFYHRLHIVQLKVMSLLTNKSIFQQIAGEWENYMHNPINRYRAIAYKSLFKLIYY